MIVMSMGVQYDDGKLRQFCGDFLDVAEAHARIEQERTLLADDQVADGLFGLMGFVDGEDGGRGFIDFEPGVADRDALESFVFGAGKCAAPVGDWGLRGQCSREK